MDENMWGSKIEFKNNIEFLKRGNEFTGVYLILDGTVKVTSDYMNFELTKGDVAGILDTYSDEYMFDYKTQSDVIAISFNIEEPAQIREILKLGKNYQELLVTSLFKQYEKIYGFYKEKLYKYVMEIFKDGTLDIALPNSDLCAYLSEVSILDRRIFHAFFSSATDIAYRHITVGIETVTLIDSIAHYVIETLGGAILGIKEEIPELKNSESEEMITENEEYDYELVKEQLSGSFQKILEYSEIEESQSASFEVLVNKFLHLPDRNSSDNDVRELRKNIAEHYYKIYEKVFFKYIEEKEQNKCIELFLKYGFMEEKEFDLECLAQLYYMDPQLENEKYNIYTVFDWLKMIYDEKKEPSKDEYDLDYKEHVKKDRAEGRITLEQENIRMSDNVAKVKFEIENFFKHVNKLVSNEITTFCPILTQHSLGGSALNFILKGKKVKNEMDKITNIDFSLFYREQMYYDKENKIDNIVVQKQVLPDIILMPSVGMRGIMWQDISEKKRDTPARFVLPIFFAGNLEKALTDVCGAFRWELCRTIQGNYWNDIREHSLTSEYCDYIQFYRKNKELSEEAKEKVKVQFKNCRNSFREMFIKDYGIWLRYESQGSIRLNKVARSILYMYCPFFAEYRIKLNSQPNFKAASERYEAERNKKIKELKSFNNNVLKKNGNITDVLQNNLDFYELY